MKVIYTVSTYTPRLFPLHKTFSPSVRRYYLPILAVVLNQSLPFMGWMLTPYVQLGILESEDFAALEVSSVGVTLTDSGRIIKYEPGKPFSALLCLELYCTLAHCRHSVHEVILDNIQEACYADCEIGSGG